MSNPHRDTTPARWGATVETASVAVIAVHGRNQDTAFIRGVTDRMQTARVTFYAPQAAENSWYPRPFLEPIEDNQPGLANSLEILDDAVAALEAEGFDAGRIVLLGFSQGACVVSQFALTRPRPYRAVVILTGGFIGPVGTTPPTPGRLDGVPIFLGTMAEDAWVPLSRVEETAALFESLGARVSVTVTPGAEHAVADSSIAAAQALIATAE